MQVILKENIETLGHIGDIVKVAPGYARNYLLPRGLALEATARNAKALDHAKRQMQYKKDKVLEQARQFAARIEALELVLPHQAGEEGKLFGSVTNMELADRLKEKGVEVDRKKIALAEPIRQLGEFTVGIKVHPEVVANLKVNVTRA
ncbi:MAG: 50S ribosomal protein L9 [Geobacter sp.]|nr:MAG: 50S ribosomal protein L9 [Geobacter sp.]